MHYNSSIYSYNKRFSGSKVKTYNVAWVNFCRFYISKQQPKSWLVHGMAIDD